MRLVIALVQQLKNQSIPDENKRAHRNERARLEFTLTKRPRARERKVPVDAHDERKMLVEQRDLLTPPPDKYLVRQAASLPDYLSTTITANWKIKVRKFPLGTRDS